MSIIKKLSDITDDLEELMFDCLFSESLLNFKFSKNVHTIYISNKQIYNINFPEKLKRLYISGNMYNFARIVFPEKLQELSITLSSLDPIIGLVFPPNLIELSIFHNNISNLIFPLSLQRLNLSDNFIADHDFNHGLHITTIRPINSPKFEFIEQINYIWHYIYLKWPRSHFIKAARI